MSAVTVVTSVLQRRFTNYTIYWYLTSIWFCFLKCYLVPLAAHSTQPALSLWTWVNCCGKPSSHNTFQSQTMVFAVLDTATYPASVKLKLGVFCKLFVTAPPPFYTSIMLLIGFVYSSWYHSPSWRQHRRWAKWFYAAEASSREKVSLWDKKASFLLLSYAPWWSSICPMSACSPRLLGPASFVLLKSSSYLISFFISVVKKYSVPALAYYLSWPVSELIFPAVSRLISLCSSTASISSTFSASTLISHVSMWYP